MPLTLTAPIAGVQVISKAINTVIVGLAAQTVAIEIIDLDSNGAQVGTPVMRYLNPQRAAIICGSIKTIAYNAIIAELGLQGTVT